MNDGLPRRKSTQAWNQRTWLACEIHISLFSRGTKEVHKWTGSDGIEIQFTCETIHPTQIEDWFGGALMTNDGLPRRKSTWTCQCA